MRYILIKDDDGHSYCIPAHMEDEFNLWVEAVEGYEDWNGVNFEDYSLGGSPSLLTFENPEYAGRALGK